MIITRAIINIIYDQQERGRGGDAAGAGDKSLRIFHNPLPSRSSPQVASPSRCAPRGVHCICNLHATGVEPNPSGWGEAEATQQSAAAPNLESNRENERVRERRQELRGEPASRWRTRMRTPLDVGIAVHEGLHVELQVAARRLARHEPLDDRRVHEDVAAERRTREAIDLPCFHKCIDCTALYSTNCL